MRIFDALDNKNLAKVSQSVSQGGRIIDALLIRPIAYENLTLTRSKNELFGLAGQRATLRVQIINSGSSGLFNASRKSPFWLEAAMTDEQSELTLRIKLVFFSGKISMWSRIFDIGKTYTISGQLACTEAYSVHEFSIIHPKVLPPTQAEKLTSGNVLLPKYSLSAGISNEFVRAGILRNIKFIRGLVEWLPAREAREFGTLENAIFCTHTPKTLEMAELGRKRLAMDEILARTLIARQASEIAQKSILPIIDLPRNFLTQARERTGFALTKDQEGAVMEILGDFLQAKSQTRLLQGDVGSGKTIVAIFCALCIVEAGLQVAVMAPTMTLARQLFGEFSKICTQIGVRIELFFGSDKKRARTKKNAELLAGDVQIAIGTHALFSEGTIFANLGFVVIDEQHRFGVRQRVLLAEKVGEGRVAARCLMMSATPIPRTLSMAFYGDINISYLRHKPPGRQAIITAVMPVSKTQEVMQKIKNKLDGGERAYWICPLIEESDSMDFASINGHLEEFTAYFSQEALAVMHGSQKPETMEREMKRFVDGNASLLLATTVVEVGVNVPEATIIVIENAERFGLSALHQLRGRVGRGQKQSYCILLYGQSSSKSLERLCVIRDSNDGFEIAEKDLEMRGAGEVLGRLQAGFEDFSFFDSMIDEDLLRHAQNIAKDDVFLHKNQNSLGDLLRIYHYDQYSHYFNK